MKFLRLFGNVVLWACALLGVVAGGLFIARKLDVVNPLIVISGSMEPGIDTGDMVIDTKVRTADLDVGDVVSLPSDLTHKLVTHRIISIARSTDGGPGTSWEIHLKGDNNEFEDLDPYYVGDEVWSPAVRLPQFGVVMSKLMNPTFSLPLVITLGALLGISLLSEPKRGVRVAGGGEPGRSDARTAALDELDEALAAFGIHVDDHAEPTHDRAHATDDGVDETAELARDPLDLVLSG